jgi:hypothetical protein
MAMIAARKGCIAMIYPSAFKYAQSPLLNPTMANTPTPQHNNRTNLLDPPPTRTVRLPSFSVYIMLNPREQSRR